MSAERNIPIATSRGKVTLAAFALIVGLGASSAAIADDAEAKTLLKAMSDYPAAQKSISFQYDTDPEFVTKDLQKLGLASSGTVTLNRPDKIRATRTGGFADVEMVFDGKTLTVLGKNAGAYGEAAMPGTIDNLVDVLRDKLQRPLPGADLLLSNVYDVLMPDVTDVKDLGSGVIGGVECDHLAFRSDEVDWQIWIAQGEPSLSLPLRHHQHAGSRLSRIPLDVRDWKTGDQVAADDFSFKAPANAKKIELKDIGDIDELPNRFAPGGTK